MTVGGAMENERSAGIFSLTRSDQVPECLRHLADFPACIAAGQGASVGSGSAKMPLVCGGGPDNRKCFSYCPSKNKWTEVGTMPQSRMHAGHANLDGVGLVMAGGLSADGAKPPKKTFLSDVIATSYGKRFQRKIPNLPRKVAGNCLVAVDKEKAVKQQESKTKPSLYSYDYFQLYSIGGFDGRAYSGYTFRWRSGDRRWTRLSSMRVRRTAPACGLVTKSSTRREIVAVGGFGGGMGRQALRTVEVLDLRMGRWRFGTSFPLEVTAAIAIPNGYSFSIAGGRDDRHRPLGTVFDYSASTGSWAKNFNAGFDKEGVYYHTAFTVPQNMYVINEYAVPDIRQLVIPPFAASPSPAPVPLIRRRRWMRSNT